MGNLPTTRNHNYGAESPIYSADLNDLQDCVIGMKHPEIQLGDLAAQAWILRSGAPTLDIANCVWTFNGVASVMAPMVRLPVGTRLTKIIWAYDRNNVGTLTARLMRRDQSAAHAAVATVQSDADAASGVGWTNKTWTYNHTIAAGFSYWLELLGDQATHKLGSAAVFGDRL